VYVCSLLLIDTISYRSQQNGASPDFKTGVETVLVHKTRERPAWSPSTVEEVNQDLLSKFLQPSDFNKDLPSLEIPEAFPAVATPRHLKFALPTEEEIGKVVRGEATASGDLGMTAEEVILHFESTRSGKIGVREKVEEVIQRKCTLVDNADGNFIWLKWIH